MHKNMQFFSFRKTIAIALGASIFAFSGAQAATKIEIDRYGNQGSYLGPWGYLGTETFTAEQGVFQVRPRLNGAQISVFYLANESDDVLTLNLGAARRQPLTEGIYEDATSNFTDILKPLLSFGLNGAGFTTTAGTFQIVELKKQPSGAITSFAASFRLTSYPAPTGQPKVVGRIWFNSDAQLSAVPEPQTLALVLAGLAVTAWGTRRRAALSAC